jgi:hypothetical protein
MTCLQVALGALVGSRNRLVVCCACLPSGTMRCPAWRRRWPANLAVLPSPWTDVPIALQLIVECAHHQHHPRVLIKLSTHICMYRRLGNAESWPECGRKCGANGACIGSVRAWTPWVPLGASTFDPPMMEAKNKGLNRAGDRMSTISTLETDAAWALHGEWCESLPFPSRPLVWAVAKA